MLRNHDRQGRVRGILGIGGSIRRGSQWWGASISEHMSQSSVYETIEEAGLGSSTNSQATADAAARSLRPLRWIDDQVAEGWD
jgi:hypothetical protein